MSAKRLFLSCTIIACWFLGLLVGGILFFVLAASEPGAAFQFIYEAF